MTLLFEGRNFSHENSYKQVVTIAKKLASNDQLVTFGIKPTFAETGLNIYLLYKKSSLNKRTISGAMAKSQAPSKK